MAIVTTAEETLRSGEIEATIDYGNDTRTSSRVEFDLGGPDQPPSIHITVTYESPTSSRSMEYIMIGTDSWEREGNGQWTVSPPHEAVWGQIQTYLPRAATTSQPAETGDTESGEIRWYDPVRDEDVVVSINQQMNVPFGMFRTSRATGTTLAVTYAGWNTVVDITPPDGV